MIWSASLAVEIPPEVQQREETVASAKPQAAAPPSRATKPEAPPAPKPKSTNWNSLVTDLGLPPIEEPEPVAPAPPAAARSAEAGFGDLSRRGNGNANESRSSRGNAGRNARIANAGIKNDRSAGTASVRRAASNRAEVVDDPKRVAIKRRRAEKTQNKTVNKAGRAGNALSWIAINPSRARSIALQMETRSKAVNSLNRGAKAAVDGEVGAAEAEVAISKGMTAVTESKAIVAVVAVANRGASQVEHPSVNVGASRTVRLDDRVSVKSKNLRQSRYRRVNRRKSQPQ